ncbi:uncharacterized protein BO80DRAFT_358996 [Aspergillus ibericus CBS 121593]|uniref:Uncharacterized protein n=1 Tax=Aspergillus ibericus CBS 121593 TaxID=1448316 RepID=A0A395GWF7_9EURO|nr:hypothetical protein BO80DRAFT_358996 [Aspergillus ibericus CBS 121593]RAK99424.1 hypothetical protein BO80DRAFT_358996 [Aspergillus ibericus CBS 121593]
MQESSTEDALYPNQAFLCQRQEYQAMMQYHYTRYNTHSPGLVSRDSVRHQLFHLWMRVHIWVELWVAPDAASRLSADDKREIIASLNGFCVQEGWDSIHRRLPPTARIEMAKVVAETMINQFICTKFLDNSFWFMDAKLHATDRNGDAHFPQRFQYLYERLKAVEPMDAAWLKTLTVQKCNELSFFGSPPPPTQLARHTAAHRTALLRSYGNELLERRVFQLLLKDEPRKAQRTQRDQALRSLLEHAAQEMIEADGGLYANLVVERLSDLPRTFQHGSDRTRLHGFHLGAMPGDGGRILMVTRPGIVFTDMQSLSHWNQLPPWRANAAEVLVAAKGKKAQAEWLAITTTTTNTASHAEDDEEDAEEDEEDDVEDAEDGDPVQEETYESGTSPE